MTDKHPIHELEFIDREARPATWHARCAAIDVPLAQTTSVPGNVTCPECAMTDTPDGGTPAEANFEGRAERRCREHRTVGPHRAWCHDDSEWCYPELPCRGCLPEDPQDAYDRGRTDGAAAQREADIKLARGRAAQWRAQALSEQPGYALDSGILVAAAIGRLADLLAAAPEETP